MEKRELKCDSIIGNSLLFNFDEINCVLSGFTSLTKREENNILIILDSENTEHQPIIKAANQFLESEDFIFMKDGENILDFGTLSIVVNPENLIFVNQKKIKSGEKIEIEIYKSSDYDIVLWNIINADFDFDLEKKKLEILR